MDTITYTPSGQAMPEKTLPIPPEAFSDPGTSLYWLGGGGALVVSRGTSIMIDPVLEGFDMPLLIDQPLTPKTSLPRRPAHHPCRQRPFQPPHLP